MRGRWKVQVIFSVTLVCGRAPLHGLQDNLLRDISALSIFYFLFVDEVSKDFILFGSRYSVTVIMDDLP